MKRTGIVTIAPVIRTYVIQWLAAVEIAIMALASLTITGCSDPSSVQSVAESKPPVENADIHLPPGAKLSKGSRSPSESVHVVVNAGEIKLWDADRGQEKWSMQSHAGSVNVVAFSPDGQALATLGERTIKLWDISTGRETLTLENHGTHNMGHEIMAFSPDGRGLAGCGPNHSVKVWDPRSGEERLSLSAEDAGIKDDGTKDDGTKDDGTNSAWISSLAYSPIGNTLAAAYSDKMVRVWNTQTGELLFTFNGLTHACHLLFSPEGKTLVTYNEKLLLWDAQTGKFRGLLRSRGLTRAAVFSPEGNILATATKAGLIQFWNVKSREAIGGLAMEHPSRALALSPDGKTLAIVDHIYFMPQVGSDNPRYQVRLWDMESGKQKSKLIGHSYQVYCVAFSPDGKTVATGSAAAELKTFAHLAR